MRPVNISSGTAKEYYYEKDPIFNGSGEQTNSEWRGKGAEALGLSGAIQKEAFERIIDGQDPHTGAQLVVGGGKGHDHRAGTDIPFTPDKTVSYQALVYGDQRLIDAHREAVRDTVEHVQTNYAYYRETTNGVTQKVQADNITVAMFDHSTSRADDPNVHTHVIFMNVVESKQDEWRALDNDAIYRDQRHINHYYQAALAQHVQERGYEIEHRANGTWGIAGVRPEVREQFSKRRADIKREEKELRERAELRKDGLINKKATLNSRPEKNTDAAKAELQEKWNNELRELGHTRNSIEAERQTANAISQQARGAELQKTPEEYVRKALDLKHETESCFRDVDLKDSAYAMAQGRYHPGEIDRAYKDLQSKGVIEKLETQRNGREIHTTREMRETEREIIDRINAGKGHSDSAFTREQVRAFLAQKEARESERTEKEFRYSPDQKEAIEKAITSKDSAVLIQGRAGAGKTTTMEALKEFYEAKGYNVHGTAWSNKAVDQMRQAGVAANTVNSALQADGKYTAQDIVIVDEAGTLGSRSGRDLLEKADTGNGGAKVIAYGDTGQQASISAGRTWKDMIEHTTSDKAELHTAKRFTSVHQREVADHLQRAMQKFREGKGEEAREAMNKAIDSLKESKSLSYANNHEDKINQATAKYFEYADQGKKTFVQTWTNADKREINERIHNERVTRGEIPKGQMYTIKEPVNIPAERAVFADSYLEGQIIRTHDRVQGFRKGQEARIIDRDLVNNKLTIEKDNGKTKEIDLYRDHAHFGTYLEAKREFSQGDKLIIRDTDKDLHLNNAERVTIEKIDQEGNFTVTKDGATGEAVTFNPKDFDRFDHGYAGTTSHTQGETFDATVKVDPRDANDFNTAVTRAKEDSHVISERVYGKEGKDLSEEALRESVSHEHYKSSTLDYEQAVSAPQEAQEPSNESRTGLYEGQEPVTALQASEKAATPTDKGEEKDSDAGRESQKEPEKEEAEKESPPERQEAPEESKQTEGQESKGEEPKEADKAASDQEQPAARQDAQDQLKGDPENQDKGREGKEAEKRDPEKETSKGQPAAEPRSEEATRSAETPKGKAPETQESGKAQGHHQPEASGQDKSEAGEAKKEFQDKTGPEKESQPKQQEPETDSQKEQAEPGQETDKAKEPEASKGPEATAQETKDQSSDKEPEPKQQTEKREGPEKGEKEPEAEKAPEASASSRPEKEQELEAAKQDPEKAEAVKAQTGQDAQEQKGESQDKSEGRQPETAEAEKGPSSQNEHSGSEKSPTDKAETVGQSQREDKYERTFDSARAQEYAEKAQDYQTEFEKSGNENYEKLAEYYHDKYDQEMSKIGGLHHEHHTATDKDHGHEHRQSENAHSQVHAHGQDHRHAEDAGMDR